MKRVHGLCCPTDLYRGETFAPIIGRSSFDAEGHQRVQRINGVVDCPSCGTQWPLVEDVGEWTFREEDGKWMASGWDGCPTAFCEECEIAIVDTFDGGYVIDLKKD